MKRHFYPTTTVALLTLASVSFSLAASAQTAPKPTTTDPYSATQLLTQPSTAPTAPPANTAPAGASQPGALEIPANVQQTIENVTSAGSQLGNLKLGNAGTVGQLGLPNLGGLGLPNLGDFNIGGINLGGLLGNLGNWLGNLGKSAETTIANTTGALGIGDPKRNAEQAESSRASTAGAALAQSLELNLPNQGSYSVGSDLAAKGQRDIGIGIANDSALSAEAQKNLATRAQQAQAMTKQNVQLGEQSQKSDVSQQILQNQSKQSALLAQISGENLKEQQQARVDRAIQTLILADQSKQLNIANTLERRQSLATGATAAQQTGLFYLPGVGSALTPAEASGAAAPNPQT